MKIVCCGLLHVPVTWERQFYNRPTLVGCRPGDVVLITYLNIHTTQHVVYKCCVPTLSDDQRHTLLSERPHIRRQMFAEITPPFTSDTKRVDVISYNSTKMAAGVTLIFTLNTNVKVTPVLVGHPSQQEFTRWFGSGPPLLGGLGVVFSQTQVWLLCSQQTKQISPRGKTK